MKRLGLLFCLAVLVASCDEGDRGLTRPSRPVVPIPPPRLPPPPPAPPARTVTVGEVVEDAIKEDGTGCPITEAVSRPADSSC